MSDDLDQPAPAVLLPVTVRLWGIAQAFRPRPGVVLTQVLVTTELAHITELTGLMAHLCDEGRHAQRGVDLVQIHGQVQRKRKNVGLFAGVREDLQRLLRGDRHAHLHLEKNLRQGEFE